MANTDVLSVQRYSFIKPVPQDMETETAQKEKKGHKCTVRLKVFPSKSQLEKRKTVHAKLASQKCQKCRRYFKRKDLFLKHKELCFPNPSEVKDSFVPTFVPITNRIDIELHESQETTESPLHQDIITLPGTSSETTNDTLNSDRTSLVVDRTEITETTQVAETASNKTERNEYWRKYRDEKRKSQNLENMIQALSSPVKRNVCRNLSNEVLNFDNL